MRQVELGKVMEDLKLLFGFFAPAHNCFRAMTRPLLYLRRIGGKER